MRYKVNCKTCQITRGDAKLRTRIYNAYYRRDEMDEPLTHIAKEIGISHIAVFNHAKKHMSIRKIATPVRVERSIEKMKAQIAKETELAFDHDAAVPKEDYERVIDGVLAEGMDQMKKTGKTITISQLLTAAKIKGDFQAKKRGQDVEIIKTMYKFSSGDKVKTDEQG